jgi:uncharacterized membrane protein YjfL (UPF0719 family)
MDANFFEAFALTTVLGVIAFGMLRLLGRGSVDNKARRMLSALRLVGAWWVAASVVHQCRLGDELREDVLWVAVFGVLGLVLYAAAGQLGIAVLLGRRLGVEIDEDNDAAAIAVGAHHIAMSLLVSSCVAGADWYSVGLAVGFFVLGVLTQQLIVAAYRALTAYDDAEQIAGENQAAAISYAGASIAAAVLIARALEGEFEGLSSSLWGFAEISGLAVLLLVVRQVVVGGVLMKRWPKVRGGALDEAISLQHDNTWAVLDATMAVTTALVLARLV